MSPTARTPSSSAPYRLGCTDARCASSASKSSRVAPGVARPRRRRRPPAAAAARRAGRGAGSPRPRCGRRRSASRAPGSHAEVLGREPPLAERVRQRVRGRRQPDAGVDELAEQPRHEHRVAASSSSNSSTHTSRKPASPRAASRNPSAPTRLVYSTNVPKAAGPGTACHSEASRCVLPTPNPPSRYTPAGRAGDRRPNGHRRRRGRHARSPTANASSRRTASAWRRLCRVRPVRREPLAGEAGRRGQLREQALGRHLRRRSARRAGTAPQPVSASTPAG